MDERSKQLEDAVGNLLDAKNLRYMRVDNYRCFNCGAIGNSRAKGWPDFFCYSPFLLAIECKTGTGKLSKSQREIKKLLEKTTHYIVVKDNIDELIKIIDVLLPRNKKPAIWRDVHNNLPHTKRKFKRRVLG